MSTTPDPADGPGVSLRAADEGVTRTSLDLTATLQLVADTIVELLGFEVAVINLVEDDTALVVAAVSGPEEVTQLLLGRRQGQEGWSQLLAGSEPWGKLRFLDHRTAPTNPADILTWIPDLEVSSDPDAWHPEDALFAPLQSADGRLLGMLSVDVPRDGKRPGPSTRQALEAFAVTAALAIEHATLATQSRRGEQRFIAVFESSPVAMAILSADRRLLRVNEAFCHFLRRDAEELLGRDPAEFTHPDDPVLTYVPQQRQHGEAGLVEKRYLLPDGEVVWGRLQVAGLSQVDEPGLVLAQIVDLTERKRSEARLVRQAHYDSLTSLPNRSESMTRLRQALERDRDIGTMTAVFFCDLDRLKLVNDAHGHAVGDAYIQEVSRRIRKVVRDDDCVGRLSGDEFVVVLSGIPTPTEAIGMAGRVIDAVHQPLTLGGVAFTPSLSLGIAFSNGPGRTADELLAQADSAMYRAKKEGRGGWRVYDPSMSGSAVAQLALRNDVAGALREGQLLLHYQPIVRLSDRAVVGYEGLLRWQHPTRGLLMPGQFLDVILDSEFESPVTDWIICQAAHDCATLPAGLRVSVNVSSLQVGRRDLPDVVTRALDDAQLESGRLVLELTEDKLLSRVDGPELLARLRALGISLALDDFGTGYAGLGYLQRFPTLDVLKLDRAFVAGLGRESVSDHIVRSVVELARGCGLALVTEGVETEEQAAALQELGVVFAQGYHFGRPAPLRQPEAT